MSKLILVPTPIGNLEDITLRALTILKSADIILAEDTRTSGSLLKHYGISTKIFPYHKDNEHARLNATLEKIQAHGQTVLVSDAGTPGISDPGFLLVRECLRNNIEVEVLPGATALIPALILSGFPCDRFVFEGFLPHKKGREKRISSWQTETRTVVFYESPHRLMKCLDQLKKILGETRLISVSRELTKMFEQTVRGSVSEVEQHFLNNPIKGEFVIVVSPAEEI
jgi:16S rRNA (cytidine1402-2'-O)-methyltransferase